MKKIKTGDVINWRGAWGSAISKKAVITAIELCDAPGSKYGSPVNEITETDKDRGVFTLDNGHWAYGHQIDLITSY